MISFKIPTTIHSHIIDYDKDSTTRKSVKSNNINAKPRFPTAGVPECLIPETVLPKKDLLKIIDELNNTVWEYHFFCDNKMKTIIRKNYVIHVALFAKKVWYAIWYDPTNATDECIFEESFVVRNTKVNTQLPYAALNTGLKADLFANLGVLKDQFKKVLIDKKNYLKFDRKITKQNLIDKEYTVPQIFKHFNLKFNDLKKFEEHVYKFDNSFGKSWSDEPHLCGNSSVYPRFSLVFDLYSRSIYSTFFSMKIPFKNMKEEFEWRPSFEDHVMEYFTYVYERDEEFKNEFINFFNTPYFRKQTTKMFDNLLNMHFYSESYDGSKPMSYYSYRYREEILNNFNLINAMFLIYKSNTNLDIAQQLWNVNVNVNSVYHVNTLNRGFNSSVVEWVVNNIPQKSFASMCQTNFTELYDSLSMLWDIFRNTPDKANTFKYEGRWRVREFHDCIMSEQWKLKNEDSPLPTELFPFPIKIGDYTVFQPKSTHELAIWGKKARNCVGGSTYYNGIKKKTHFIFLITKNNSPEYTIQAQLRNGVLEVLQHQSVSTGYTISNNDYSKVFQKALKIREKQLQECDS